MDNEFLKAYDLYYDAIYRYIYAKVGSKWDAEDIVGEVFRKAFEHFESIRSHRKAWLFTIARNSINDFYRRSKFTTVELKDEFYADSPSFEDELLKYDEFDCLKRSLVHLNDEELDLIAMRYFSDLRYEEIARVKGKQSDYLRVKASRTIKKIGIMVKKCLEG